MAADIASATTSYGYQEVWDEGTLYYRCNPRLSPRPEHDLVRHWQRDGVTAGIALFICHHW
jgi:hypothetical protein